MNLFLYYEEIHKTIFFLLLQIMNARMVGCDAWKYKAAIKY